MINQKVLEYVKQKIAEGNAVKDIKAVLLANGWQELEVNEVLAEAQKTSTPPPTPTNSFPSEYKNLNSRKFSPKIIWAILGCVFLVLLIAGGAYLYINKERLFAIAPYTEENLLSGLLTESSKINTSSYSASASLIMGKRDADAVPFTTKISNANEIKAQYRNDYRRAQDVNNIFLEIKYRKVVGVYPTSLQLLKNQNKYYSISVTDPVTQQPYDYKLTDNGKNFSLSVTFETSNAISQIRKSREFSDATTIINGKTVTFTKDSNPYFYLQSTPPKPFLIALAEYMAYIPSETKVSASASAQSDWSNKDSADWKFNADATGDLGDLTYKFNLDALRKDSIYYLKINNMPSLFFSYIGLEKGQWIKIDPNNASSPDSYYEYSYLSEELLDAEKYYKEYRQEIGDLLKKMMAIADDEKLITLKHPAYKEKIDGRSLYRYDLEINKNAIIPFYKKLEEESNKTKISKNSFLADSGYLEYLQSPEFSEVFDYYQKNTTLTLWVDSEGYPAIVSYNLRIVPPDSATQLKDKQANIVFKLVLSDINKPVDIQTPVDSKDLQDVLQINPARKEAKDRLIELEMGQIRVAIKNFYLSKKPNTYIGSCNAGTDCDMLKTDIKTYQRGAVFVQNFSTSKYCIQYSLDNNGGSRCIDSSGYIGPEAFCDAVNLNCVKP